MVALPEPKSLTVEAIYKAYEARQGSGFRRHLGASLIGTECPRSLWMSFRWVTRANHTGRLLRLFSTGQLAEQRFVDDLRAIGVTVMDVNPETGRQWQVSAVKGHFGGSADAVGIGFPECPKTWCGIEMKTHSDKSFNDLTKNGLFKSKPLHYAQLITYLDLLGLERGVYIAVNKNDDSLHVERIHADPDYAKQLLAKAEYVINSPHPPERAYHSESFFMCRFCQHLPTCWQGVLPERSCRTCVSSTPVENGRWRCERHNGLIDPKHEEAGCDDYLTHPGLVAGEVTDAGNDFIQYQMKDGTVWVDGVPP